MKRLIVFIKRRYNSISVLTLFVLTGLLVLYLLPREGKFRYEFQRGRPWLHETLIAPFNFPIYKTEAELNAERDSILSDLRYYFRHDSLVVDSVLSVYMQNLDREWNNYFSARYSLNNGNVDDFLEQNEQYLAIVERFADFSVSLFRDVYGRGIIAPGEVADRVEAAQESIVIVRENIGERTGPDGYFRQRTAYEYIRENISEWFLSQPPELQNRLNGFFSSLEFSDYIVPNLQYDMQMTNRVRQSMLNDISLARGMVQAGERIVSRGDLITNEVFQILESLRREYETMLRGANLHMILLGQLILVFSLLTTLYLFLYSFRYEILVNIRKTLFILFLFLLMVSVSIMLIRYSIINFYIVPFAIVPIIIRTFYDERLALFVHTIILLLVGFFAPNSYEFVLLNFIIGIVAIFSLTKPLQEE
jgi:cyclic-di-AMP phosphodiesterase PgpH